MENKLESGDSRVREQYKEEAHTVSTNTKVNLLLERVGLEGLSDTQDSILFSDQKVRIDNLNGYLTRSVIKFQAYRRALGDLGPGRGLSGTENHEVSLAGGSRTAGDT